MKKISLRPVLDLLFALLTIAFNALASILPLNGLNTGEISDRFKVFFVPAGYVFSIWGLLYLSWIAFGVFQLLPAQAGNTRLARIGSWFVIVCLANMGWLYFWHHEQFLLTGLVMLVLLASLIVIYLRLQIGLVETKTAERWCVDVPFSLYLGWVSVATIANFTSILDYVGWNGWGISPQVWTAIMLAVAVTLAGILTLTRRDIPYLLVFVWAFSGIAMKHAAVPMVASSAWIATAAIVGLIGYALVSKRAQNRLIPSR